MVAMKIVVIDEGAKRAKTMSRIPHFLFYNVDRLAIMARVKKRSRSRSIVRVIKAFGLILSFLLFSCFFLHAQS